MERLRTRALRLAARGLDELGTVVVRQADAIRRAAGASKNGEQPVEDTAAGRQESNRRFADALARQARASTATGPNETTYVEDVLALFADGISTPMYQEYVNYALGSLKRGEAIAERHFRPGVSIRSYADIGCAYGGSVLAMANRGVAKCVGVDYDERLLRLARKQAMELGLSGKTSFLAGDICDVQLTLRLGKFDLVTCTDVLEHVLDPSEAIISLARLTEDDGIALIDVPNPTAYQSILKDPHHNIFGNVLLRRDDAIRVFEQEWGVGHRYDVGYYHPLEWYTERLEQAGFAARVLDSPPADEKAVLRTAAELARLGDELLKQKTSRRWPDWRYALALQALREFETAVSRDRSLQQSDPAEFQLRYSVPVIHFECKKKLQPDSHLGPRPSR